MLFTEAGEAVCGHKGYIAHILDTGASAGGTWTSEIGQHTVGWRCECSCGWAGPVYDSKGTHAPSDEQDAAMMATDWVASHARLLLLADLGVLERRAEEASANFHAGVRRARAAGVSWELIGTELGVSRQAAWERFGKGERAGAPGGTTTAPELKPQRVS